MSDDLLKRLDVPMPPYADEDGYYTVPAWVVELAAEAAARIRELEAQLSEGSFYQEKDIDAMQDRIRELEAQITKARAEGWRRAIEAAAAEVDCACDAAQKRAVLATAAPNGGPRWMACGAVDCSAMTAAAIRAIPLPADLGGRDE